jgi:isopentenyl-diphosphate delta-isomerase
LNIESQLEFVYKFSYSAEFGAAGSENELCHVYLGHIDDSVRPNDHEIDNIRFVRPQDLTRELAEAPAQFTPWFKQEWQTLLQEHADKLARYGQL